MINCPQIGVVEITGSASEVLAEYCFITSRLARALDKDEVAKVFLAGLEMDTIMHSGKSYEECWKIIDDMVNKSFGKEGKK